MIGRGMVEAAQLVREGDVMLTAVRSLRLDCWERSDAYAGRGGGLLLLDRWLSPQP